MKESLWTNRELPFTIFFSCAVGLAFFAIGLHQGERAVQREAVERGLAEQYLTSDGEHEFRWVDPAKEEGSE